MKNVTDTNIILVTLSSVDLLHYILLVSLTCSLMVFVVVGFFSDNDRKMRYKIPSNVVSLVMLILSTISLGIYIATAVIIAKEYGATNYVFNDPLSVSNYALFNIIFGCSTAALFISKGIRNYEKLVAETTAK